MRVTEQSETRMVAQRSPYTDMAVGAAIIVAGIVLAITTRHHGTNLGVLICVPFAAVGVYQILFAKRVTIVVDKSLATVSIAWRTLVGSGDGSVGIADIDRVTYREFISESSYYHKGYAERRATRKDTSLLVLKDGSAILLDKESTSAFGTTLWLPRSSDREVDWALAGFIGVPLVDNGTSTGPLTAALPGLQPDLAMAAVPGAGPGLASASGALVAPVAPAVAARPEVPALPAQPVAPAVPEQPAVPAVPAQQVATSTVPAQPVAEPEPTPVATPAEPAAPAAEPVAQIAPVAPCLAPSSAPAGSPYWCETPPPWAR